MRRIVLSALVLLAALGGMLFALGVAKPSVPSSYKVRAIFDDAAFAVSGEEVRIAGAPVGVIDNLDVTAGKKAAVTIEIDNSAFVPFHLNGHCTIRVQSLIGEKYVDCTPGDTSAPALTRIRRGPGAGTYYLPVGDTTSPIDTDIVQGIYRLPVREQFGLILNELGTGLAARGSDLNAVIRRANPALHYTDEVLQILAHENHLLAQLSTDSNRVLGPLAQVRGKIADFVIQANRTSVASATRAIDEARSIHLLPEFLRQLRPLMADLGTLADQGTPLFKVLTQAGPGLARQYENLASFARATRTSLIALGQASVKQQPALLATIPLDHRLGRLATATLPTANLLNTLLTSFDNTGGIEQLMATLFNFTAATNGYDKTGHYIRTEALVGGCSAFALTPAAGCSANFASSGAAADFASATPTFRSATPRSAAAAPATSPSTTTSTSVTSPALRIARSVHPKQHEQKQPGALRGLLDYLIGGSR